MYYARIFDKLEQKLQICKQEKQKIITNHQIEIKSSLKNQVQSENQKHEEQK